ncbi:hypothetical protein [uncultured Thiodictyon sp.]|uniref:hypothetical protein n=1 Tax=uncultured Thiodictyon sp. TaxID=1846217 RepID=UPI0025D5CD03|nr:hypothetical protein [uncultured Thiodictyon sp.]
MKRLVIASPLMALCVPLQPALALDAACDPIMTAGERKIAQDAWHSIIRSGNTEIEYMKVDRQFFVRIAGRGWEKAPDFDDVAKKTLEMMRNGEAKLTNCKDEGSGTLDGRKTKSISYTIEMPGLPSPSDAKLTVGKDDGLPYSESSGNGKATIHYDYQNVVAPRL